MLDTNKLHCGDCLKIMATLPSESIDVVVTSPPYNMNDKGAAFSSHYYKPPPTHLQTHQLAQGYTEHADNLPHADYVAWQRRVLTECLRVLKPTGAIFYNINYRLRDKKVDLRNDIVQGFPVRQLIIWENNHNVSLNSFVFDNRYEFIFCIAKPDYTLTKHGKRFGNIWFAWNEKKVKDHPATFPKTIPIRAIAASAHNDIVLDPFIGSGTTAIAAHELGVKWIGIDSSETYLDIARRRIDEATAQGKLALPDLKKLYRSAVRQG